MAISVLVLQVVALIWLGFELATEIEDKGLKSIVDEIWYGNTADQIQTSNKNV